MTAQTDGNNITVRSKVTVLKLIELAKAEKTRYRSLVLLSAVPHFLGETDRAIMQAVETMGEPTTAELGTAMQMGNRSAHDIIAKACRDLVEAGLLKKTHRMNQNSMRVAAWCATDCWFNSLDEQALEATEKLVESFYEHLRKA